MIVNASWLDLRLIQLSAQWTPEMCVCVCVCVWEGGKTAEARNSLITYSININSAWGFTFILVCFLGCGA